ncbi:protein of unknown function [Desulfacinum hydrothermale DSM 13146]|uniref:Integrase DNA-binding domain-containing protein n=1 Tax=Desulfacinum hydrothermale DSM 13146 TaxID=1121390 RepID=A0A1W1XV65_9BACT|nr:Arm DNA-binding domain-containing protein [Desulfacinum hydrothermale]SMC27755.1 protein of unknown function [Desulfacinum hydrothermale DSM 13146]
MRLTDTKVRNLKPREKPYKVHNGGGLYLQVTPARGKLWRLKYRFEGKEKTLSIVKYPLVFLSEGREKARQANKRWIRASVPPRMGSESMLVSPPNHTSLIQE